MLKTAMLIFRFYRGFALSGFVISVACAFIQSQQNSGVATILTIFKLLTLCLVFVFIHQSKTKEYYFYHNLGISVLQLWIGALVIDLSLFTTLLLTAASIR